MAFLHNLQTNETLYLFSHHTFGRRREGCDTCIPREEISKIHAAITWNGQHWQIRDLSRNGTWLDGGKLPRGEDTLLKAHQVIYFASNKHNGWLVENLDAPKNLLVGLNQQSVSMPLTPFHLLPNNETPLAALYLCSHRQQWLLDVHATAKDDEQRQELLVQANDVIELADYRWRVWFDTEQQETKDLLAKQTNADHCEFHFEVSLDEEHVQLSLEHQGKRIDLGERSHHYLLMHLARVKSEHAALGLDPRNRGWIDNERLVKELGMEISHINIQLFRARKQLAETFPNLLSIGNLLQRRRGELRFDYPQARISKGACSEVLNT